MNLLQRFKRLTFWNKLGTVASLCSILGFIGWLVVRDSSTSVNVGLQNSPHAKILTTVNSPGAVQIAADTVKIDLAPKLENKIAIEPVYINKQDDGKYISLWRGKIEAPYPIPSLRVEAHGRTVEEVDLSPMRSGLVLGGNSGKREDYAFTTLQNAIGNVQLRVVTKEPEKLYILFSTEE